MTRVRAEEDILIAKPGQIGAFTIAYRKGEMIREEDLEALGLTGAKAKATPQAKPAEQAPQDKAKRGPREPAKKRASRDKALSEPKES